MRIAAIDIGTNSIHMVIARATGDAGFEVVDREREVVQIGRGSFSSERLRADAIQRTVAALRRFTQLARRHQVDKILCTTTAAVREASNGGEFQRIARELAGVMPRVIPAEEEGRLIYLGVKSALQLDEHPALIVDIGGGSMQLVDGDREKCHQVVSKPLGALRLTETMIDHDPPTANEMNRLKRQVRKQVRAALRAFPKSRRPERVYGSSGSIHAVAQIAHWDDFGEGIEHLNGHVLATDDLARLVRRLVRMPIEQRERLPGIDSQRAEILIPGALVLLEVLEQTGVDGITLSDFGVREGLVTDYLNRHAQEISSLERVEDLKLRSVLSLAAKFSTDMKHAQHISMLSLALFDGLRTSHGLGPDERELLHFAALLHDSGSAIGYDDHGAHSFYIVQHGNLRGLSAEEVAIVANVARYHGKPRPRRRDEGYGELPKSQRRVIQWLSAMLRIAEGLDRSHYQLIRSLRVARRPGALSIFVGARRDAQLELWAARRRTAPLEKLLEMRVRVAIDPAARASRTAELKEPLAKEAARPPAPGSAGPRAGAPAPAPRSTRPAPRRERDVRGRANGSH